MSIRSTCKALILRDGKVLVNRCTDERNGATYYDLPGGGQHLFESMEDAVIREVAEETGYRIRILRFAAIAEEIWSDEALRKELPDYSHRIAHIFLAEMTDSEMSSPTETDFGQEETLWMPLDEADKLPFYPMQLTGRISEIIASETPMYLGTTFPE